MISKNKTDLFSVNQTAKHVIYANQEAPPKRINAPLLNVPETSSISQFMSTKTIQRCRLWLRRLTWLRLCVLLITVVEKLYKVDQVMENNDIVILLYKRIMI